MKKILLSAGLALAVFYSATDLAAKTPVLDKEGDLEMEYKQFGNTYVLRLDKNADIPSVLKTFCKERKITLGSISGLGSLKSATLGFFDPKTKDYEEKTFDEPLEMASLVGNIAMKDGEPLLHLHTTIAGNDYEAYAGHMVKGIISLTAEIYITVINGRIEKTFDPATGLNRLDFKKK